MAGQVPPASKKQGSSMLGEETRKEQIKKGEDSHAKVTIVTGDERPKPTLKRGGLDEEMDLRARSRKNKCDHLCQAQKRGRLRATGI